MPQFDIELRTKFLAVVIYDIGDNKKRSKMSKLLCRYGYRVQRSAFECSITNRQLGDLCKEVDKLVEQQDLVRIYKLTDNATLKVWGNPMYEKEEDFYLF